MAADTEDAIDQRHYMKTVTLYPKESFAIKEPVIGEAETRFTIDKIPLKIRSLLDSTAKTHQPQTLELMLEPESLGKLTVTVNWYKGQISAQFFAQSQHAAAALNRGMEMLRENLSKMQINVTGLSVVVAGESAKEAGGAQMWGLKREKERIERDLGFCQGKKGSAAGGKLGESSVNCLI
jgi:hypothetical protein